MSLHHVRGGTTHVRIGVVDPLPVRYVLTQIIAADTHQFRSVQSGAALPGRAARVSGDAGKGKIAAHDGRTAVCGDIIGGGRMPGIDEIAGIEQPCPRHKLFGARPLFCRTAIVDHSPGQLMVPQVFLDQDRRQQRSGPQAAVAAAVPGSPFLQRFFHGTAALLAQRIQRIVLAEDPHHRTAAAEHPGKTGRHACQPFFHRKALFPQDLTQQCSGLHFLIRQFREVVDAVVRIQDTGLFLLCDLL